jgi:deoxyhypusine synthase
MKGRNRIGNLVVPNDNYCKFEDWVMPILDKMVEEQKTQVSNIFQNYSYYTDCSFKKSKFSIIWKIGNQMVFSTLLLSGHIVDPFKNHHSSWAGDQ